MARLPSTRSSTTAAGTKRRSDDAGGIDLQLLGIGRTGHIGFNEPGSGRASRTRLITLDRVTRRDAASDFFGEENVPTRAITMGVGTILECPQDRADGVRRRQGGDCRPGRRRRHLDDRRRELLARAPQRAVRARRSRRRPSDPSPRTVVGGPVEWNEADGPQGRDLARAEARASRCSSSPTEDYNEEGLQDLLATSGDAYDINLRVFRTLQGTITGWPGGKPEHAKQPGDRPQPGDHIFPKRVLIFSPHPDDDVISMGGTLIRLVDQGHEVHVAYQTSGNIAVFDDDAIRFAEFVGEFNRKFGIDIERTDRARGPRRRVPQEQAPRPGR